MPKPTSTDLAPAVDTIQRPLLVESLEYRRQRDQDRADAITKIERIDADMLALRIQLEQLQIRRDDLSYIVSGVDQLLVVIPGPETFSITQPDPTPVSATPDPAPPVQPEAK